ncbi:MAG: hypothetical protein R3A44_29545 [Caldilineaceae bacterium]
MAPELIGGLFGLKNYYKRSPTEIKMNCNYSAASRAWRRGRRASPSSALEGLNIAMNLGFIVMVNEMMESRQVAKTPSFSFPLATWRLCVSLFLFTIMLTTTEFRIYPLVACQPNVVETNAHRQPEHFPNLAALRIIITTIVVFLWGPTGSRVVLFLEAVHSQQRSRGNENLASFVPFVFL